MIDQRYLPNQYWEQKTITWDCCKKRLGILHSSTVFVPKPKLDRISAGSSSLDARIEAIDEWVEATDEQEDKTELCADKCTSLKWYRLNLNFINNKFKANAYYITVYDRIFLL